VVKKQIYSNGSNTPLSGIRDLYRASTSNCAISQNNQDIASRLSASYLDLTWQLLLQTNSSANLLAWERDNDLYTFTNQAVKYQKSTLASYQTNNNLYGGPFGGMENYFANIKTYFGQTKYDQMIEGFMRASSLYIDTIKLAEWHIYGSSRIGIYEANLCMASRSVRVESGTETQVNSTTIALQSYTYFTTARGAKRFELTNHLGNVLAVITDKKVAICSTEVFSHWKAELVSATDYSPFGAPLAGRTFQSSEYRFGFNGKEKDDETYGDGNELDFGARIYSPRLSKWLSVDPMQQKYPNLSPYNFSMNSPISLMDPNGKWVERSIKRYDGNGALIPAYKLWVKAKTIEVNITIHNAKLYNGSDIEVSPDAMTKVANNIQSDIETTLSKSTTNAKGQTINTKVTFSEPIKIIDDLKDVKSEGLKSDNLIYVADPRAVQKGAKDVDAIGYVPRLGSNLMVLDVNAAGFNKTITPAATTPAHEQAHEFGISHNQDDPTSLMYSPKQNNRELKHKDSKQSLYTQINKGYSVDLKRIDMIQQKGKAR